MIVRETCGGPAPVWGKRSTRLDFEKQKEKEEEEENGGARTKIWDI